jgi:endonuclease/exonuclease/phosphatase family metal-dependent hydrolase
MPRPVFTLIVWTPLLLVGCSDAIPEETRDGSVDRSNTADTTLPLGEPVTLTLATFNVKELFDDKDDPDHSDEVRSSAEVSAKIKALGKALRTLKADILALQEVENKLLLERLNTEELKELAYDNLRLVVGNDMRGMNVAILSRYPIPKTITHGGDRFSGVDGDTTTYGFSRDCLEVTVEPSSGRSLVLLINHLRATTESVAQEAISRRHAQAQRVREIADHLLGVSPEINLAVMGDLNDVPDSETLRLIQDGTPKLIDPLDQTGGDRTTFIYQGKKEQLDFILLAPSLDKNTVKGSAGAQHDAVFSSASDHYPVLVRVTIY